MTAPPARMQASRMWWETWVKRSTNHSVTVRLADSLYEGDRFGAERLGAGDRQWTAAHSSEGVGSVEISSIAKACQLMTEPVGVEQTANGRKEMARTGGAGRVVGRLRVVRRSAWRDAASWTPFLSIVAVYSLGSLLLGPLLGWRGLILPESLTLITAIFGAVLVCVAVAVLWAFSTSSGAARGARVRSAVARGADDSWGRRQRHPASRRRGGMRHAARVRVYELARRHPDDSSVRMGRNVRSMGHRPARRQAVDFAHTRCSITRGPVAGSRGSSTWPTRGGGISPTSASSWCSVRVRSGLEDNGSSSPMCSSTRSWARSWLPSCRARGRSLRPDRRRGPLRPAPGVPYRRGSGLMSFSAPSGLRSICGANTWPAHSTSRPGSPRSRRFMFRPSTLLALALWLWRRWAGVLGWLMVAVTLFGSVALGWHYAVDGYAALVGMLALWWVAGRIVWRGGAPDV